MNLPNKLTIIRIILTPIFLFFFLADFIEHNIIIATLIFIVGSITDTVDGHLARKNNIVTNFGKIADPIADKILTTSALLCFMQLKMCSVWVLLIVLAREFTVSAIRISAASQGLVIPANIFGKIKTVSQMTFSIIIMLFLVLKDEGWFVMPHLELISEILLWITAAFTLISGIIYVKDSVKVIDFTK